MASWAPLTQTPLTDRQADKRFAYKSKRAAVRNLYIKMKYSQQHQYMWATHTTVEHVCDVHGGTMFTINNDNTMNRVSFALAGSDKWPMCVCEPIAVALTFVYTIFLDMRICLVSVINTQKLFFKYCAFLDEKLSMNEVTDLNRLRY